MNKYVCTVCGFVYDEAKGMPESGISPGTKWEDLPPDWVCPLCGATKEEFVCEDEAQDREKVPQAPAVASGALAAEANHSYKELTPLEVSALCSNLARGCEKQYMFKEEKLFTQLAEYFEAVAPKAEATSYEKILALINQDLEVGLPQAKEASQKAGDRGALRALVWSEKVTKILKSLISRYQKEGEAMLENTGLYVCTICGFVYVGDKLPEVCPVCKVPNWKFAKVEGGQ